jgi:hypothetical protein
LLFRSQLEAERLLRLFELARPGAKQDKKNRGQMLTKVMKCVSIAALVPTVLWQATEGYQAVLQLIVCAGALLVAWQGFGSERQIWAIGFAAIAVLFNPFQPLLFSRGILLWLNLISIAAFLASLVVIKAKPKTAMASITI